MKPFISVVADIKVAALRVHHIRSRSRINPDGQTPVVAPAQPGWAIRGMRIALYCWVATSLTATAHAQTTVVVAKSNTALVVGADSKAVDDYGHAKSNVQKILPLGFDPLFSKQGYVAVAGFYDSGTTALLDPNAFNVPDIMRTCGSLGRNVWERAEWCTASIKLRLPRVLTNIKGQKPDVYERKFANKVFLSLIFFGVDPDGSLGYYTRDFLGPAQPSPTLDPQITGINCGGNCKPSSDDAPALSIAGHYEAILQLLAYHPDYWKKKGLIEGVRGLIEQEIHDCPAEVGPPIRIMLVTKDGAGWVQ